jgi:hypothetical protein
VKRFDVEAITEGAPENHSSSKDLFGMSQNKKNDIIKELKLKYEVTKKGIYMDFLRSMAVSKNGDFVWGFHVTESRKGKVLRQCFSTGELFLYDYEHQKIVISVSVAEDLNIVISGGWDNKAVLHDMDSGKIKKIIDLQYGDLCCLIQLGNLLVIGDEDRVRLFDMVKRKDMDVPHIKLGGYAICMLICKRHSEGGNVELLVGNNSPKLNQITVVYQLIKGRRNIKKMRPKIRKKRIYEEVVVEIESLEEENQLLRPQKDSLESMLSHLEGKTIQKLEARQADLESELESVKKRKMEYKEEFFNLRQGLDQKKNTKLAMVSQNSK